MSTRSYKLRLWLTPVILIGLFGVVTAVPLIIDMQRTAHHSCLASVKAAVEVIIATNGVTFTNLPVGAERVLSYGETLTIFRLARGFDCARFRGTDGLPIDKWGHPFHVRVANTQWGIRATAFSAGRDGKPGTGDDVL